MNLDTINYGFIRPANSEEWTLAYCQAELYCEYVVATFGDDALAKLLKAYRENLSTAAAIKREFAVEQAEFERGYEAFVKKIVEPMAARSKADDKPKKTLAELEREAKEKPEDAGILAALALAQFEAEDVPAARKSAVAAQKIDAKNATAGYVLARVRMSIGETEEAEKILSEVHNEESPDERVVSLLAAIRFQADDMPGAERYFLLGLKQFYPREKWQKALARVYLKTADNDKLAPVLTELAGLDYDNATLRKKLAEIAASKKDWKAAERWAIDALFIDLGDAELHAQLANARAEQKAWAGAIEEYRVALELNAEMSAWRLKLAECHIEAGEKDQAKAVLEKLIELAPDFPGAKEKLKEIAP
jgi:Tfp pilus assembly protein PilF